MQLHARSGGGLGGLKPKRDGLFRVQRGRRRDNIHLSLSTHHDNQRSRDGEVREVVSEVARDAKRQRATARCCWHREEHATPACTGESERGGLERGESERGESERSGRERGERARGQVLRAEQERRGQPTLERKAAARGAEAADPVLAWREFAAKQLIGAEQWTGALIAYGSRVYLQPAGVPPLDGLRVVRAGWYLGEAGPHRFEPSQALAMGLRAEEALLYALTRRKKRRCDI